MGYLVNGVTITLLEGFEEDAEGAHMGCPDGQLLDSSSLECVDDSMEDSVEEARRPDPQQARYERQMQVWRGVWKSGERLFVAAGVSQQGPSLPSDSCRLSFATL
eukprot:364406-Chlamydomonas_euryale.AAC.5